MISEHNIELDSLVRRVNTEVSRNISIEVRHTIRNDVYLVIQANLNIVRPHLVTLVLEGTT